MIPIEKISGAMIQNLMYYIAIVGILLVVATIIRLKLKFLQKIFIPASLLAGVIGLILGPYALKIIPQDMMSSIGALPGRLITIVFACMLLGIQKKENDKTMLRDTMAGLGWLWSCSFMQVGIPAILCAFILIPIFGVNPLFASLTEIGFAGGHGTAGGMAQVFEEMGWQDGASLGSTMATVGLLCGIIGGMIIINLGVRKNYTKVLVNIPTSQVHNEIYPEGSREASSYKTIDQDVVESFAFHIGIIGIAILIGRAIVVGFKFIFTAKSLPLFPFAMIGGWIINSIVQKTPLKDLFDRKTFQRIQGVALEILIVCAMAAIKIPIVVAYFLPILITTISVMLLMLVWFFWLSPRIFKDAWFEQGIIRFGTFCGVSAVGYMLLRTTDPQMETNAGSIYALGSPFMSPFIGGGLVTSMWPSLIASMGVLTFGLISCGISIAILFILRILFWNNNFQKVQRNV